MKPDDKKAALDTRLAYLEVMITRMANRSVDGIAGVLKIDSGLPGPVLGITACTHGNEPSGLAAIEHLLDSVKVESNLLKGTLYLVVNNLEAAKASLASRHLPVQDRRKQYRFIDMNMNRLPKNLLTDAYSGPNQPLEIKRARELAPIWATFTHGLDIHSTVGDIAPMIITGRGALHTDLVRGFPITKVLTEIDVVQIGSPVFGFFGGKDAVSVPVFEIEAGTHQDVKSFKCAAMCAEALLKNLGMIAGKTEATVSAYEIYEVFDTIVFPNNSYEVTRTFQDFEKILAGTRLAQGRGHAFVTTTDCHTLFCVSSGKPLSLAEEVMFLSRPMQLLQA